MYYRPTSPFPSRSPPAPRQAPLIGTSMVLCSQRYAIYKFPEAKLARARHLDSKVTARGFAISARIAPRRRIGKARFGRTRARSLSPAVSGAAVDLNFQKFSIFTRAPVTARRAAPSAERYCLAPDPAQTLPSSRARYSLNIKFRPQSFRPFFLLFPFRPPCPSSSFNFTRRLFLPRYSLLSATPPARTYKDANETTATSQNWK